MFVDGSLRMFLTSRITRTESSADHYACLGRRGKPLAVGSYYSDAGTGYSDVPAYVFARGRYLARYDYSDGEGGPSADWTVIDLRDRTKSYRANVLCCEDIGDFPEFLVAGDGSLLTIEESEVFLKRPSASTRISDRSARAEALAIRGATVYWTESSKTSDATAKSLTLDGVTGSDEPRLLTPTSLRRGSSPCASVKGRTVAASRMVRVYETSDARFACRYSKRLRRGGAGDTEDPAPRVVGDRWVLMTSLDRTLVLDSVTRRRVTVVETPMTEATLLANGTLAWIDDTGRVLAQKPADDAPNQLGTGGWSLASGMTTVYWTAGGLPQRAVVG